MNEKRCDLCGPVTPEQAAAMVRGHWRPEPTGYLCDNCTPKVREAARRLAEDSDAMIAERIAREVP